MTSDPTVKFGVTADHRLIEDAQHHIAGIFVATLEPRELGDKASLKLELPWGETLELHGHVEWLVPRSAATLRRRAGMGVRCELQPWQEQLLDRLRLQHKPIAVARPGMLS